MKSTQPARTHGLGSAAFLGLLFTQFLTAVNDNVFRWLVIGIGKDYVEPSGVGTILMAGTASFVLPYILLAAPAGYLADRFSKRQVIVVCKFAEIVIMVLGVWAIWWGNLPLLIVVVALMGAQSALFGPAKMGTIPELLRPDQISAANGFFGLTTVAATVIGMAAGNWLSDQSGYRGQENLGVSALVLIGVAVVGTLLSLAISRLPAANPRRHFPWNVARQTIHDLWALAASRPLLRVAIGIVFFWSVGCLAQLNIDQFAAEGGAQSETAKVPFLIALVCGVGFGSVLAGVWSAGRVELGILPLGAFGIAASAMALFFVRGAIVAPAETWTAGFVAACSLLFVLGTSAGLFSVPLEAYLQHRSPPEHRGAILAASNFLTFTGVLLAAVLYAALRIPLAKLPFLPASFADNQSPLFTSQQIFFGAGVLTLPVFVYIVCLIPQASIRFFVWLLSRTVYRVRVVDRENLPETGGALLTPNHVSFIDALLLMMISSRPIRMVAYAPNLEHWLVARLAKAWGVIPITPKPKAIAAALRTARQAILDGELVCIFPEGAITRSGQLLGFKPGLMRVIDGTGAPVIPVYLDGLWGSIFSFERRKFFWKMPKKWPYPVAIFFGKPVANPDDVHQVRGAVEQLGVRAMNERLQSSTHLVRDFIRTCRRRLFDKKAADSTGAELTGGQLLMRTLILRRLLRRNVLAADEQFVGLLLPPAVASLVANLALAVDRRVSANLNYTVTSEVLNGCIELAGIRHVLTSHKFMEKFDFQLDAELIYLEDFKSQVTLLDKLVAVAQAYLLPQSLLAWWLNAQGSRPQDLLTVIFTSGSTGTPKGVMLSHGNIASQVEAIEQVVALSSADVLIGVLPFFHSFGYTVTLWTVATINVRGAYHFNPLDAKQVGKLCQKHGGTILLATPTFLRTYLRRCEVEEFQSLQVVVAGAEKLPLDLCDAFEKKFGVRPVEGYGATELSPLVSVNVPPSRSAGVEPDLKEGSVGRPITGVSARIVSTENGADLGVNQSGMLLITGPNVMLGYLNRDDLTAEAIRDGWYVTGDIALLDDAGFITITGRESRFSKIGGEMIPHIQIEECLAAAIATGDDQELRAAVTAVPDEKKGERLIVLHTKLDKSTDELRQALSTAGLPNLYIPAADSFLEVPELPILGSGKLDLKKLKQIALDHFAQPSR